MQFKMRYNVSILTQVFYNIFLISAFQYHHFDLGMLTMHSNQMQHTKPREEMQKNTILTI